MVPQDIILEKSLIDCHCKGLDSLVLKDGPGMIRMFIARPEHELWRNNPGTFGYNFSVGLHRHHCDITLMPVLGEVYNVMPATNIHDSLTSAVRMRSYRYTSHILDSDKAGFDPIEEEGILMPLGMHRLLAPWFMKATQLHSIYVPHHQTAAWFVWEGQENRNHNSLVYSNDDLTQFDFSGMDRPMEMGRLREDLAIIGVRV